MDEKVRPEDAAAALNEIGQRQEQVINLAIIPSWFWWAISVLMVGFSATIDSHRKLVIAVGTTIFVIGVLATTGYVVLGAMRRAQPRNDLLGPLGVLAILGLVALTIGVSLPVAFALRAAGSHYAATLSVLVGGVVLVVGGPLLMRFLRRLMLANRTGAQR